MRRSSTRATRTPRRAGVGGIGRWRAGRLLSMVIITGDTFSQAYEAPCPPWLGRRPTRAMADAGRRPGAAASAQRSSSCRGGARLDALRHHAARRLDPAAADAGQLRRDAGRDRLDHDLQHPGHRHRHADDRLAGGALRPAARHGLAASSGFTVATWLCGQAESLETLVLWRILQGGSARRWCRCPTPSCSTPSRAARPGWSAPSSAWRWCSGR